MKIESLRIDYKNEFIISDIDDCIFDTTKSIIELGVSRKRFYFDKNFYEQNKHEVFKNAKLTEWGQELIELIDKQIVTKYLLITSASNRLQILCDKLNINKDNVIESMKDSEKLEYLNGVSTQTIYVDDKTKVINNLDNNLIQGINYPKKSSVGKFNHRKRKLNRI